MAKEKVHRVTQAEIDELMSQGLTKEQAECELIDKYPEVIFPDEPDDINAQLKENRKAGHVYDNKKGKRTVERKPDNDKRYLIDLLYKAFGEFDGVNVTNIERQVDFNYNGFEYSITLTKHRKAKNG